VDDAVLLGVGERRQRPLQHTEHLHRCQPADERPQRSAREVLHRDVRHAVGFEEVVDDDDVRRWHRLVQQSADRHARRAGDVRESPRVKYAARPRLTHTQARA
jgi:hypothetical protein